MDGMEHVLDSVSPFAPHPGYLAETRWNYFLVNGGGQPAPYPYEWDDNLMNEEREWLYATSQYWKNREQHLEESVPHREVKRELQMNDCSPMPVKSEVTEKSEEIRRVMAMRRMKGIMQVSRREKRIRQVSKQVK